MRKDKDKRQTGNKTGPAVVGNLLMVTSIHIYQVYRPENPCTIISFPHCPLTTNQDECERGNQVQNADDTQPSLTNDQGHRRRRGARMNIVDTSKLTQAFALKTSLSTLCKRTARRADLGTLTVTAYSPFYRDGQQCPPAGLLRSLLLRCCPPYLAEGLQQVPVQRR